MEKTIIMLMGKSGSGKSTLERRLVETYPNLFHKVVSMTTRPMREGEIDGVDYYFVSQDDYDDLDFYGEIIQNTYFAGTYYGSRYDEYTTKHPYAILCVTPKSAATFIETLKKKLPNAKVITTYFDVTEPQLIKNMHKRGDSPEAIKTRLDNDDLDHQFKHSGIQPTFTITDNMLTDDLHERFVVWLGEDR